MADSKIQEEARLRYPKVIGEIIATGDLNDYRRWAFIAGAEWQKQQMLKDAVETYYGYVNNTTQVFLPENKLKGVKEGYVKIIILKDDE